MKLTPEQLSQIEQQNEEARNRAAFRAQLEAMWNEVAEALPVVSRAQLRIVKIAVVDALDAGKYDEAAALIEAQPVPGEFIEIRQSAAQMLRKL